ncbi:hypothetical protein IC607_03385 [Cellulomonas sp. JH27-2]|uniref:hypothetical protein n=1 Tax=Cellulomonas sp. JH27-2 TaxID=2774139 RepID=UPI00177D2680|nr:hypothetical protein [Cellulomonas sp. JH27-2]MBD8058007.1 hypothetical protein [Cellulomonas sp. JH27-2]
MSTSQPVSRPALPRWVVPATLVVGILLVGGGGVALWRSLHRGFGWFAYAPMSETVYSRSSGQGLGIALLVTGALVLGAVGGFVVGRRTR